MPVTLPADDDASGWSEYAAAIERVVGGRGRLILVAQSLAGFSAPLVCERVPVDLLVLLNAMIPRPGETGSEWWSNTRQDEAQREYFAKIGLPLEDADDPARLYFHDVPSAIVADAFRRGEPAQSMTPMSQPWPADSWPDVPTRVLIGRDDRLFPATFQRRIARERLFIEGDEIDCGHLVAQPPSHARRTTRGLPPRARPRLGGDSHSPPLSLTSGGVSRSGCREPQDSNDGDREGAQQMETP